jgi:UDP-N-acetylglucosamine--N-acetylmuramyl-(pentapeptide) pyrophosphoryl-undecaprenol N-acetylglucosamine transferase
VPLRTGISHLDRPALRPEALYRFGLRPDLPVLFVSGGSSGARTINLAVAAAAKRLAHSGIQVLHVQGGRNDPFEVPADLPVPYRILPYLSEMQLGYAAADLMLCRGGAITVAETTALGVPAIYVPYPHSNQEQKRNALPVVEAGGGILVDDAEVTPQWVEQNVIPLVRDRGRLAQMGAAAAQYGRRDGDEKLLEFVLEAVAKAR